MPPVIDSTQSDVAAPTKADRQPWMDLHERSTIVDVHAHPSLKISLFRRSLAWVAGSSRHLWPPTFRTSLSQLRDGGVDVILSSVYAPEHGLRNEWWPIHLLRLLMPFRWNAYFEGPYRDVTLRMMDELEREVELQKGGARIVRTPQQLRSILDQPAPRPIAFIHCLEGAHCLDENLDNLQQFADLGVAYLTLAHFYDNGFAPPCYPFDEKLDRPGLFNQRRDVTRPLTSAGKELIHRMNALGIIPDVAHCTPVARRQVYELMEPGRGLLASHVGVQAINPSPYNLTDDEIRLIADRGGVIAVIFMNYWLVPYETGHGINEIVHTLRHLVNVGGAECVALGTDFDGFTDPPDDMKDARDLPYLTSRLVADGFHDKQIEGMVGGNALRLLLENWKGSMNGGGVAE